MKDLLVNSSEATLSQSVDEKFRQLEPLDQGVITYLKFLLHEMFCVTNYVVTELQSFLKAFADEGLTKTVGGNVSEASAQIKSVSERLSEVNQPPLEARTYVIQGLTKCYVPKLTGTFEMMLNQ